MSPERKHSGPERRYKESSLRGHTTYRLAPIEFESRNRLSRFVNQAERMVQASLVALGIQFAKPRVTHANPRRFLEPARVIRSWSDDHRDRTRRSRLHVYHRIGGYRDNLPGRRGK